MLSLASCTGDGGASVYWLNFKPEIDETLRTLAERYTEETGVEVKIVTAASGSYEITLTSEMDKSQPPTLFVIGNEQAVRDWGEFATDLRGTAIAQKVPFIQSGAKIFSVTLP